MDKMFSMVEKFVAGQFGWFKANWKQVAGWYLAYRYGAQGVGKAQELVNHALSALQAWK